MQRQYCAKADAQDLRGIHETNDAFHVALFSACGNPYLVRSLQDYMNLTLPMRAKNLADSEGLALSRRQHEFMIELLKGRDSWALAQLCVDHMQYSKSDYLGRIAEDESKANACSNPRSGCCRRRTPCCRTCRPGSKSPTGSGLSLACSAIACSRKSSPRPVGR